MHTYTDKIQSGNNNTHNQLHKKPGSEGSLQSADNRPEILQEKDPQEIMNNSPQVRQLMAYQQMMDNSPQVSEQKIIQAMADHYSSQTAQLSQKSIEDKKATNTGLPDQLKTGIESLSGMSMDHVKVHYNSPQPSQLNALAYAQGNTIHIGPGQEKHLPHEAWHVVQQAQGRVKPTTQTKEKMQVNDDAGLEKEADEMGARAITGTKNFSHINKEEIQLTGDKVTQLAEEKDDPKKKRLAEIEAKYRAMIKSSRDKGYNVAADMLQRFLDGTGGTAILGVGWLRSFSEITDAEKTNQERFEKSLTDKAYTLNDGDTISFADHWDRMLTSSVTKELYYASGTSTLSSMGTFTLSRKGNIITISGSVEQFWHDPYDWHGGLGAYIPGYGYISDDDALFLQDYGKARSFEMESRWKQHLNGTIEIINWWPDSVNYDWKGP